MDYKFNNLYELLIFQVKKHKNKVAFFVDETKITYKEILETVDTLAGFLAQNGVQEGDKVALFLRNSTEFIYTIFAVSKLGAILVPINTFLKEKELNYILEDSGSSVLVASLAYHKVVNNSKASTLCRMILWEGEATLGKEGYHYFNEIVKEDISVEQRVRGLEDTAIIIYTSGTTGRPKGAMLSNKNILSNADSGRRTINVKSKDIGIVFLPMFHSFTFTIGLVLPLSVGASIVIIKSMQPFSNIFKQVFTKRVTLFFGVPDVYNALVKAKFPWYFMWFNKIRAFISGAAALQPKTLDAMSKKFKRASLLEGYGLSEASPAVSMNTFKKQKAGSVGIALYGYDIKIVDDEMNELPRGGIGDIITRGDNIMQGYLNRPEATAENIVNGWLITGDMGYMDDEGFLFIVDRKKDLIISKGINIYPREIEEAIDKYEGVNASAVIGIVDDKSGEVPIVYIELHDDIENFEELDFKKYMREHLANYKVPKQIYIIKELPKNATGKVLKRVLKDKFKDEKHA